MATKASFELDTRELIAVLNDTKGRIPKAAATAVNRSAKSVKTAMVKVVREDVGLKAKDVRDAIRFRQAKPSSDPAAQLRVSKKRIPLIRFGGTPLKRAGWRSRMKGGTKTIPGGFKAKMRSGHVGVFRRKKETRSRWGMPWGSPELPIRELHGPSLAKPFAKHWRVGARRYREQLPKNLKSALRFAHRGR